MLGYAQSGGAKNRSFFCVAGNQKGCAGVWGRQTNAQRVYRHQNSVIKISTFYSFMQATHETQAVLASHYLKYPSFGSCVRPIWSTRMCGTYWDFSWVRVSSLCVFVYAYRNDSVGVTGDERWNLLTMYTCRSVAVIGFGWPL